MSSCTVSEGPIPPVSLYKSQHCLILPQTQTAHTHLRAFRRALFLTWNVLLVSGKSMCPLPSELCSNVGGLEEHCTLTLPCPKTLLLLCGGAFSFTLMTYGATYVCHLICLLLSLTTRPNFMRTRRFLLLLGPQDLYRCLG